ncbi:helix-turn-helix domain-containing protein [Thermococcus sp. SY098]|uniref:helix-turn-helix domain-containing protein n=1 Tax=Thermococcus sp. SY098 TaxID=3111325 RepID=UPI002D771E6B|nr:helix-turn-helix domain-containing protein [Thermococcus sp. SY098]WRS52547.1 helix-turn-helix domain-containing protein [Thermococcus sp. SY098]
MVNIEEVLELIKSGYTNPKEIARVMGISVEEVSGIIKILESLGYIEKVEFGSSVCSKCPMKKICSGSCIHFKGQIYQISEKNSSNSSKTP